MAFLSDYEVTVKIKNKVKTDADMEHTRTIAVTTSSADSRIFTVVNSPMIIDISLLPKITHICVNAVYENSDLPNSIVAGDPAPISVRIDAITSVIQKGVFIQSPATPPTLLRINTTDARPIRVEYAILNAP